MTMLAAAAVLALVGVLVIVRPVIAGQLFALATPWGLISLPGGAQLVTAMAILVIAVVVVRRSAAHRSPLPTGPMTVLAVVWSVGILWSVATSGDPAFSAVFGTWQIIAALFAVAWGELASGSRLRPILLTWLLGSTLIALSGLVGGGSLEAAYGGAVVGGRPIGVFAQPNEYGTFCMLIALFGLGLTVMTRGVTRWFAVVAFVSASAGLILSLSRGAWLGAIAGVVALLLLAPRARTPVALGAGVSAALVLAWVTVNRDQPTLVIVLARLRSVASPSENPYDNRPALLSEGLRQFLEQPWFGQGPNMYPAVSSDVGSLSRTIGGLHPHNLVVATAAEQGLVGLFALLGIGIVMGAYVASCRRRLPAPTPPRRRPEPPPLPVAVGIAAGIALVGFVSAGLVDFPMRNALMRTTAWTMVGWVIAARTSLPSRVLGSPGSGTPTPGAPDPAVEVPAEGGAQPERTRRPVADE